MFTAASADCSREGAVADALLQTERLMRRFGGVTAADAVALTVASKEVHAIIGPNGAGKTTLIGLLSGEIVPQSSVTIQGPGANALAISANHSSRIFDLQGVSLSISGLTLENGYSPSGSAISVDTVGLSLNVSHCDFQNNVAATVEGSDLEATGGAIASDTCNSVNALLLLGASYPVFRATRLRQKR